MTYVQRLPLPRLPAVELSGRTVALLVVAACHLVLVALVATELQNVRLPWKKDVIHPVTVLPPVERPKPAEAPVKPLLEPLTLVLAPPDIDRDREETVAEPLAPPTDPRVAGVGDGPGAGPDLPVIVAPRQDPAHPVTRPPYPPTSARLGEAGAVILHLCLDAAGAPTGVTVKESSGYRRLDDAAVRHLRRPSTRFLPGTENGRPVPQCIDFRVRFDLMP